MASIKYLPWVVMAIKVAVVWLTVMIIINMILIYDIKEKIMKMHGKRYLQATSVGILAVIESRCAYA